MEKSSLWKRHKLIFKILKKAHDVLNKDFLNQPTKNSKKFQNILIRICSNTTLILNLNFQSKKRICVGDFFEIDGYIAGLKMRINLTFNGK